MPAKKYPSCTICGAETNRYKFCDDCREDMHHTPYKEVANSAGPRGITEGSRDILPVEDYGVPQDIIAKAEIFEEVNKYECERHETKKVRDGFFQFWGSLNKNKKK